MSFPIGIRHLLYGLSTHSCFCHPRLPLTLLRTVCLSTCANHALPAAAVLPGMHPSPPFPRISTRYTPVSAFSTSLPLPLAPSASFRCHCALFILVISTHKAPLTLALSTYVGHMGWWYVLACYLLTSLLHRSLHHECLPMQTSVLIITYHPPWLEVRWWRVPAMHGP